MVIILAFDIRFPHSPIINNLYLFISQKVETFKLSTLIPGDEMICIHIPRRYNNMVCWTSAQIKKEGS